MLWIDREAHTVKTYAELSKGFNCLFSLKTSSVTSRIYIATLHKNPYVSDPIV